MLTLVLTVAVMAFFAGLVGLIARLSGRGYAGQVTCPLATETEYDNPYPGWGNRLFGLNTRYEHRLAEPPAVAFDRWSESRSRQVARGSAVRPRPAGGEGPGRSRG